MSIFNIFTLLGGLAFFLFGMSTMSNGLERVAGGKLERILGKMTDKPIKGLLLGAGITATIQSSSAVTVMLVGLVNSGIMKLGQSVGVIMGSNIGTTITAWILSLAGIDSDNFFVSLLKPSSFSPLVALGGILLMMVAKKSRSKDIGSVLMGFAVLMYGMELMSGAMDPLADSPQFAELMVMFTNPLLGLLVGIGLTAVVQSSSATVGILQALSMTGSISFGAAIPIIMGQNIGTCITALISSIGVGKHAKRVSAVHVSFNMIGTAVWLTLYLVLDAILSFSFTDTAIDPFGIAVVHSVFNIATTILLFPFSKQLEKLAIRLVKDKPEKVKSVFLDERLIATPSLAVAQCREFTSQMARLSAEMLLSSVSLIENFNPKTAEKLIEDEKTLDDYEDKLGTFLVKLSGNQLSDADSNTVSTMLHTIGDFERIGDHALNIVNAAQEIYSKEISFSAQAKSELKVAANAICEITGLTSDAFCFNNSSLALEVEPLEQVIDDMIDEIKSRHIARLTGGSCTIELGFVLSDLLTNFERVSDHCSNIAVCILRIHDSVFDAHEYLNNYKNEGGEHFTKSFNSYAKKHRLPEFKQKGN
ncbi:MAG: Na/Pi cotransporter family protein [Clostridia bacterium]|nr:Na/Pi cotransporter family protein [Clostridia bacterium]